MANEITYKEYQAALEIVIKFQEQIFKKDEEIKINSVDSNLEKLVIDLHFSERISHAFEEFGILKVKDILRYKLKDFENLRNFGPVSIKELKSQLNRLGILYK